MSVATKRTASLHGSAAAVGLAATLSACSGGGVPSSGIALGAQPLARYAVRDRGDPIELSGSTLGGGRASVAALRGKVVVLNVWGSWCGPCRAEAPELRRAARDRPAAAFLGIDVQDNDAAGRAFQHRYAIPYASIADHDSSSLLALRRVIPTTAVPSTVVLDASGRIAARVIGKIDYTTLTGLVDDTTSEASRSSSPRTGAARTTS